jgi:glycosyltransferase involved in cell wall biosynthesis
MRLLFLHGEGRVYKDDAGNHYTSGSYNENVWKRYLNLCDELVVVSRVDPRIYPSEYAKNNFNLIPPNIICICVPDVYKPYKNYFILKNRRFIKDALENEIKRADRIIIRSLCDFYTNNAFHYCKKYKKRFLVEVIGFEFEQLWIHSKVGKIVAPFNELRYRWYMKHTEYAVYVTKKGLQKRYPTNGKSLGCSDVEIIDYSEEILSKRLSRIDEQQKIVVGTAALLDIRCKKQENVVKALNILKKSGYTNFEYQLVGNGSGDRIKKYIDKYGLSDSVKIIGELPHECIDEWLDSIDIYIQPSYVEGLSRAIGEAMGRACPVICSNVGANDELISREYMYDKNDIKTLANKMVSLSDRNSQKIAAKRNYKKIKEYTKDVLDPIRGKFYHEFMQE